MYNPLRYIDKFEISSNRKNAKIRNRLLKSLVLITLVIAFYSYSVPFLHAKNFR